MVYTPHQKIKPQHVADTYVGLIYDELLLTNLITPGSFDGFKGYEDDTVNVKVPGLLPARSYAFRNDRNNDGIQFDQYSENTVPLTFTAGRIYSAVRVTDEQNDFDQTTVDYLAPVQARAVARGMENDTANTMRNADYEVVVGGAENDIYKALVEARKLLNKFRVQGVRNLVVGSDFEAALLLDKRFTAAISSGEQAGSIMRTGNIGNWVGFNIFVSDVIAPDEAIAFTDSSFAFAVAAPYVPASVPFGATAASDGYALRWLRDYDLRYVVDRSLVDCFFGSRQIKDKGWVVSEIAATQPESSGKAGSTVNTKVWQEKVLPGEYNVRSFKVKLEDASASDVTGAASNDFRTHLGVPSNGVVNVPDPVTP